MAISALVMRALGAATIAGQSALTVALSAVVALAAAISGVSTVAAVVACTTALAATVAATSTTHRRPHRPDATRALVAATATVATLLTRTGFTEPPAPAIKSSPAPATALFTTKSPDRPPAANRQ